MYLYDSFSLCVCVCVRACWLYRFASNIWSQTIWQVFEATFKIDIYKYRCVTIEIEFISSYCNLFCTFENVHHFHISFLSVFLLTFSFLRLVLVFFSSLSVVFLLFGWHNFMVCDISVPVRILQILHKQ